MQLQTRPDMPLSYFLNIIIATTESNTLEFPGVDRGTSSSIPINWSHHKLIVTPPIEHFLTVKQSNALIIVYQYERQSGKKINFSFSKDSDAPI